MKPPDVGIRYVAVGGDDSNDGLSWVTAKASIVTAVQSSLPATGTGKHFRHTGKVKLGVGYFDETESIEFNAGLTVEGIGTHRGHFSGDPGGASVIRRNHDGPIFAPTPEVTWGHGLILRDLQLDGNQANYPAVADLVHLRLGGFNTAFYNVFFAHASGFGLYIEGVAANCYLYNCTGAGCSEGWLKLDLANTSNLCNLGIFGAQVDDCGPAVIHIEDRSSGDTNNVMVYGLETESTADSHDYIIRVDTLSGHGPTYVTADGISAWRQDGNGIAVCARTGPGGGGPRWAMRNIHGSGYGRAFLDTELDIGSVGTKPNHITQAAWPPGESVIGPI